MASPSETVLITGHSGFTGQVLAPLIAAGGRRAVPLADAAGRTIDLRDGEAVAAAIERIRPDVVVHLAGITTNLHPDVPEIYAVNVVGTANLLAALAKTAPRLVIVASSATVYAPPSGDAPLGEDWPVRPAHHYGASKAAVELLAGRYGAIVPILITRPFNYTGPGQTGDFVVAKLVRHFKERAAEIRLGNLDLHRDFSDVSVVAEIYARLVAQGKPGETLNIATGRALHLADIPALLTELTGHRPAIVRDPRFVRAGEPARIVGDVTRLEAAIGPLPEKPFAETLRAMLAAP